MREVNKIAESLFEKIRDRFEDVSLGNENAKATSDPEKARFFNFDYVVDGENHGNITMSLIDETSLKVYFSKNITDGLSEHEKKHWYHFLRELREFAKRNLLSFEPRDITRSTLKHRDIAQQSKADATYDKDEVIGESKLYGTSKSSYQKFGPARIIVRHSAPVVDEMTGARSRHINSIYVENSEGERFKMPFKSLTGARAMARHVSAGGTPHDDLGKHICEMAMECTKLKPFMNNVRRRTFEDSETQSMVEAAFEYHGLLNNTLKRMSGKKGYTRCKEQFVATSTSYIPEDEANLDEMKERFIKRVFNEKMTDALPLVYKAYDMKKNNKFTEQFESWANNIAEGSWALPKTPDDQDKLIELLSQELPVGVDAQNATNALYSIFGDDILFDKLGELAAVDPKADARDTVMDRLQDLNPTMYQAILDELGDPDKPAEPGEEQEINEGAMGELHAELSDKYNELAPKIEKYKDAAGAEHLYKELAAIAKQHGASEEFARMCRGARNSAHADYDTNPGGFENWFWYLGLGDAVDEGNTYGSGDGGMDGVVYEERDIDDNEQVCVYCGTPRGDKFGCCDENHWETKKEFDNNMNEDKEECKYCGGDCPNDEEHACDGYLGDIDDLYKDQVKEDEEDDGGFEAIQSAIIRRIAHNHHELLKKLGPDGVLEAAREIAEFAAPVEEIGSSDVSGWVRQIERDAGIEQEHSDLHEAFERALNEAAINVGDIIRDRTQPEISGKVVGDMEENYTIQVDGEIYHIKKLNAEVIKKFNAPNLEETDSRFMAYLKPLVGQQVYIPAEGTTGTVVGPSPNPNLPTGIQVKLANGQLITTAPGLFKAAKPGLVQQAIDKLNALTGKIAPVPTAAKPYGKVPGSMDNLYKQDWSNVHEDIKKLAGLK